MHPTVAVIGIVRFPPERMAEVHPHVRALVEATRRHDDCISYDVAEDILEPGLLRFSETWPDHASLERHVHAPHVVPWREASQRCGILEKKYITHDITGTRAL